MKFVRFGERRGGIGRGKLKTWQGKRKKRANFKFEEHAL
jgi:hypothetical protein